MRYAMLTVALFLAACGSDEPDIVIEGVDPVQSDGDLAPDATLAPAPPALEDEAIGAPGGTLEPEATLQPSAPEPIQP